MQFHYNYNGFLNVYKEAGWTSMDVCAKLKRITGVRKIGHAGTLDPMAEGVLPVAIGIAIVSRACGCVDTARILAILAQFGLPTSTSESADDILSYALSDKKRSANQVNLILPNAIGNCSIVPTPVEKLKSFIQAGL